MLPRASVALTSFAAGFHGPSLRSRALRKHIRIDVGRDFGQVGGMEIGKYGDALHTKRNFKKAFEEARTALLRLWEEVPVDEVPEPCLLPTQTPDSAERCMA